tara:strand:+ start:4609 stop:5094 length:486 start_codon:yes stop_codon:yes gene_type:complete
MTDKQRVLDRLPTASDADLKNYAINARRKLPELQWLIDAVASEQANRGGLKNITPDAIATVLIQRATERRTIGYAELAEEFGVKWPSPRYVMMPAVGEMAQREEDAGRPMLSVLIVQKGNGKCGKGFIDLAKTYGRNVVDAEKFERDERERVFEYWSSRSS